MNTIDILDNDLVINGTTFNFPISYEEVKAVFGEARIDDDCHEREIHYIYDDLGLIFEGSKSLKGLKYVKAYKDDQHNIEAVRVFSEDHPYKDCSFAPKTNFIGDITFLGQHREVDNFDAHTTCVHRELVKDPDGDCHRSYVGVYLRGDSQKPNYCNGLFTKALDIIFCPERPKSKENYNIVQPDGPCLFFDNFNFKLAVINELMYEQEILKPYFDLQDYMEFKKANWNLETEKNVRGAVKFFKELPIPASLADKVEVINCDGGNDIYLNIAPLWDGEDGRFDIDDLSEVELKQFKNLKEMVVMSTKLEKLRKICDPLEIKVELL